MSDEISPTLTPENAIRLAEKCFSMATETNKRGWRNFLLRTAAVHSYYALHYVVRNKWAKREMLRKNRDKESTCEDWCRRFRHDAFDEIDSREFDNENIRKIIRTFVSLRRFRNGAQYGTEWKEERRKDFIKWTENIIESAKEAIGLFEAESKGKRLNEFFDRVKKACPPRIM